jgi:hypothetical protein
MNDDELDITDEERAMAAELVRALETPSAARPGTDGAFALALKASHATPVPALDPAVEERAIERALTAASAKQRRRTFTPLLLAAAVLLLAVPAAGTLNQLWSAPSVPAITTALPTADALLGGPIDEDQAASDRTLTLSRARTRSYFESRIASERGAR